MKDAKDVDVLVSFDQVSDPVVAIEQDADLPLGESLIAMTDLRKIDQHLCLVIDTFLLSAPVTH